MYIFAALGLRLILGRTCSSVIILFSPGKFKKKKKKEREMKKKKIELRDALVSTPLACREKLMLLFILRG